MNVKRKSGFVYCISLIFSIFLLLGLTSCATSKQPHQKGKPEKYKHYRSKQPKWNTTNLSNTKYVIKDKKRKKYHY